MTILTPLGVFSGGLHFDGLAGKPVWQIEYTNRTKIAQGQELRLGGKSISIIIPVPRALLLGPILPSTAKVLWMLLCLPAVEQTPPISQRALAARGHFARRTVQRGLSRLEAEDWAHRDDSGIWVPVTTAADQPGIWVPTQSGGNQSSIWVPVRSGTSEDITSPTGRSSSKRALVAVPVELLEAQGVSPQARVLYGALQLVPGFAMGRGECTYRILRQLTGRGLETMRRAMHDLSMTGWVRVEQRNTHAPIEFTLANPEREREENEVADAEERLLRNKHKGEGLMLGWLDRLVNSDDFVDHFRPEFLANEFTGMPMELDRYYIGAKVAYEFNGPQHYRATRKYSRRTVKLQQARDDIKYSECKRRGITVVIVQARDLTLETMLGKVEGILPLTDLRRHQRVIDFLERVSRGYRREAGVG